MNHNLDPRKSAIYKYIHPSCGNSDLKFLKLQKKDDTIFFHCYHCAENFQTQFKGGHLLTAEENLCIVYP